MQGAPATILFAGGGTGGHLFPGLAIADEIRKRRPETRIVFAGTREKIEGRVVPARGYEFAPLWISGFRRSLRPETLLFPLKVSTALAQALLLIQRLKPAVVVGTGGYVCGPPIFAATLLGIPTLLQEQNSYPGVTTRLLASRVNEVHLTFDSSRRYLRRTDNIFVSGNPTRDVIGSVTREDAERFFGITPGDMTVLVFGGSLGAASINSAVLQLLPSLAAWKVNLVWQTGATDYSRVREAVAAAGPDVEKRVRLQKFIDAMEQAYAVCDIAVCRAGATTLAELTRAGVPAILVPYPYAAADHQTENARAMVDAGAATMCADKGLDVTLAPMLQGLLEDPQRLRTMSTQARALGKPEATSLLATAVLRLAERRS